MMSRAALAAALLLSLSTAALSYAGEPTEQLKRDIPRVFHALDPSAPREAVHAVSADLFDWGEMSRQMLGPYWPARTTAERERFTDLLHTLVDAHLAMLAGHRDAPIVWVDESINGDLARVRTRVSTKPGRAVPLDYRLIRRDRHWLIYDVALDGVSLVANYRAQFSEVLKTSSYESLVEKLAAH